MRLQVSNHLLHSDSVLDDLLLALFCLDAYLEHLVDDLLQVFNHIVVLCFEIFVSLIDDTDENFSVVLQGSSQRLQIVIDLIEKK